MQTPAKTRRLLGILQMHFAKRKDFYHVVTGPKRETWFSAETIVALARAQSSSLMKGFVIHGELSYNTIHSELGNATSKKPARNYGGKIPDVFAYSAQHQAVAYIIEIKLIDDLSSKTAQASLVDLKKQLETAKAVLPNATAIGIVYAVHHLSRAVSDEKDMHGNPRTITRTPERFYEWVEEQIEDHAGFPPHEWLDAEHVKPVIGLQKVRPLGGNMTGEVSLGIGAFVLK